MRCRQWKSMIVRQWATAEHWFLIALMIQTRFWIYSGWESKKPIKCQRVLSFPDSFADDDDYSLFISRKLNVEPMREDLCELWSKGRKSLWGNENRVQVLCEEAWIQSPSCPKLLSLWLDRTRSSDCFCFDMLRMVVFVSIVGIACSLPIQPIGVLDNLYTIFRVDATIPL